MGRKDSKDRGVFERPPSSGVWWIRYHDAQGKEHREKIGPKALAKQVYAKRKTQVREGQFFPQALLRRRSILLAELISDYLLEAKANHRSFRSDQSHARLWTKVFGEVPIDELTPADLEKWKRERMAIRAKATVVRELAWLKRLFNVAIRDEKIDKNPVNKVQFPKLSNGRVRYLTDAEEQSLRAVMDPADFEAVEIALNTGLRRSEQFNLRWEDIDLRKGILTVTISKNGQRRYLPLNDRALEILKTRRKRNKSSWVFPSQTGETPLDPHNFVVRVFNPALRLAGVRDFTWHCCRHTYASRLVMAGVDLRTTQELMGHLTIQMTLRYSHLAPSHLKDAVNRLLRRPQ